MRASASERFGEFSQLFLPPTPTPSQHAPAPLRVQVAIFMSCTAEVTLRLLVENIDAAKARVPAATRRKQSH